MSEKLLIPVPTGLALPQDARLKPFALNGTFILVGDSLLPVSLGGLAVECKEEDDDEDEDEGECGSEEESSGCSCPNCDGSCCGGGEQESESGDMQNGMAHGSPNGFILAIEKALSSPKRA